MAHGSEMGRAVLAFDWQATPLGPPNDWPEGLRSAVAICLSTRFPMLVVWGPELISIYNDGYRPILGRDKHPWALGIPARDVWPEVWHYIGPLFESVIDTGRPTWEQDRRLVVERNGFPEETYFTFSYSPLFDRGEVGGVLDLVVETTSQVVANRRLECLSSLGSALADAEQVTQACLATTIALAGHRDDVRFADVFLRAGDQIVRVTSNRRDDMLVWRGVDLTAVIDSKGLTHVGGDGSPRLPAELAAVPLGGTFRGLQGVLVAGLNPERPFDRDYRRFVESLADTVSSALEGAYRRSVEIGEYRRISDTLQAAMLPPSQDLPTIAARYAPAVDNLAVGGDWYDVVDLDERRRALVVGDCVGHGLEAATAMAQLRSAARAALLEGRTPAEVLSSLDTFAAHTDGAFCATVLCVIYDRAERQLTYAGAGHPPPLVVGPAGFRWLDESGGPPLAVTSQTEHPERTDVTVSAVDDEVLVLYSDGLIERRGEPLDLGMSRLAETASRIHSATAQAIADHLLHELLPDESPDDVVLVVKRLGAPAAGDGPVSAG
ncbi:MAG TPA: SpoIIE family protein phosphatase [Ilumatobacter sp.]|nr:SpoIIE family protein phosphatase [Ilumatobacter sp.]